MRDSRSKASITAPRGSIRHTPALKREQPVAEDACYEVGARVAQMHAVTGKAVALGWGISALGHCRPKCRAYVDQHAILFLRHLPRLCRVAIEHPFGARIQC